MYQAISVVGLSMIFSNNPSSRCLISADLAFRVLISTRCVTQRETSLYIYFKPSSFKPAPFL
ncbi:hypothetical protein KFK09_000265 [Dendrobium nobile]|uniref:Uncharacterized protein n=1 Tax=Dendrobium nobile TaxID=94219 RepID=A0A8T3CCM7_DENNO|nr:hypothetical protein KFK09_000265 [Dendrobium nobile]